MISGLQIKIASLRVILNRTQEPKCASDDHKGITHVQHEYLKRRGNGLFTQEDF